MSRKSAPISCSEAELRQLQNLADDTSNPRLAKRARMVLACIEGSTMIKDIAASMNERPNTVILWKTRFAERGIPGLFNLPRGKQKTVYGEPFRNKLLETLAMPPPGDADRWTGRLLSQHLEVPPDVVWRYLRKEGIKLRDPASSPAIETAEISIEIPVQLTFCKETDMNKHDNIPENNMDLEFVARIIGKDGSVIERTIRIDDCLPDIKDFDLSTKEGFLRDFDTYEKTVLAARNQIAEDITSEYLDEAAKKNRIPRK